MSRKPYGRTFLKEHERFIIFYNHRTLTFACIHYMHDPKSFIPGLGVDSPWYIKSVKGLRAALVDAVSTVHGLDSIDGNIV